MSVFKNYIEILTKCYTPEIENKSFLSFVKFYPQYQSYYDFITGKFDNKKFLNKILNDGTVNLLDINYINKKESKNLFTYIWTLIEMENSYSHIIYCLPIILQRVSKDNFFTEELAHILSEPHDIQDIGNEKYINVQSNIIDFLSFTHPVEIKTILKKYKFDMMKGSDLYQGSKEPDYSADRQYLQLRYYLKYLKNKSTFLTENFHCNIDYTI